MIAIEKTNNGPCILSINELLDVEIENSEIQINQTIDKKWYAN